MHSFKRVATDPELWFTERNAIPSVPGLAQVV